MTSFFFFLVWLCFPSDLMPVWGLVLCLIHSFFFLNSLILSIIINIYSDLYLTWACWGGRHTIFKSAWGWQQTEFSPAHFSHCCEIPPYSDVLMLFGGCLIVGRIKSPFRFRSFYRYMLFSARGFRSSLSSWQDFFAGPLVLCSATPTARALLLF